MPIKIDPRVEKSFEQVAPSIFIFLLDILRNLHPGMKIEDVEISNMGTELAIVFDSVEKTVVGLSLHHQQELRDLAKAFGEKLLQEIDKMLWEPKIEDGKIVAFRRKVRRTPRVDVP